MAFTGKIYKCVSMNGASTQMVKDYFKIGKTFKECDFDLMGGNLCDDFFLLLYSTMQKEILLEDGSVGLFQPMLYVDKDDFELVSVVKPLYLN